MHIDEFQYDLPEELIAQTPTERRGDSRLMVLTGDTALNIEHKTFSQLLDYLSPGDCLVMNDSKVLPARLIGEKQGTGAKVEFLLIKRIEGDLWETMVRPGKRLKPGDEVVFSENPLLKAKIVDYGEDGTRLAVFTYEGLFLECLEAVGKMPLPPYINREATEADKDRYQTVYCHNEGSVAAPTAGLHFTGELLREIEARGVKIAYVTLHVGIGTFRPVKCEVIEEHSMHREEYYITEENAALINGCLINGGRLLAVGTTSVRTMESAAAWDETHNRYLVASGENSTNIFIYPGYRFKIVKSLLTNFHLPGSTLLMLISALYGKEEVLAAYNAAVKEKYRFFSYGDAMLIL